MNKTIGVLGAMLIAAGVSAGVLQETLPRTGAKLERGEPYTILAVGDSVTVTGNYQEFLARRLKEFTGNEQIKAVKKGHGGCSADATSRNYEVDVAPFKPDLLLIMYGLNDQICFAEPETYLANYRYIADRAVREFGCDVLFLQPTPHPELKDIELDSAFPWRTGIFAAYLARAEHDYPVIPTFSAFGHQPARDFPELFQALHRLYPASDHIHPNVAGHEKLAETVMNFLTRKEEPAPLAFEGRFRWPAALEIRAVNLTSEPRQGRLVVLLPDRMEGRAEQNYQLAPGGATTLTIELPELKEPADLLHPPWSWYLKRDLMAVTAIDFGADGEARVTPVPCPRGGADALPPTAATLPPLRDESGRIPVIQGTRARELVYTRYGSVLPGEARVDGELGEWQNQVWSSLGAAHQARNLSGPADARKSLQEKWIDFTFQAGEQGLYVAFRIKGSVDGDSATLYFDPRSPELFNTIGRYFWVGIRFLPEGKIGFSSGETADRKARLDGAWRPVPGGAEAELFIPYAWFRQERFPESGDLGFSLVWTHQGPTGEKTTLNWAESGHAWTPRNYGVIRLQKTPEAEALPYRIRFE